MASSSDAAARRSLRPHTAPNVRENLRKQKERVLARQAELEQLAAPIHDIAAKLGKLDALVESRSSAGERKIEHLEKAREKKIDKIRAEFAVKIDAAREEAQSADHSLTAPEKEQEQQLLHEYAQAIVAFGTGASAAELGVVLGVSIREAKKIVEQAKQDLGVAETADTVGEPTESAPTPTAPTEDAAVTAPATAGTAS